LRDLQKIKYLSVQRIAIIGCPGSGKSTLANKLGGLLNRPIDHLDKEYWTKDWEKKYSTKEEWDSFHNKLIDQDSWIIDGNYENSMDKRLERADTIIFFDISRWVCLWRAVARTFDRSQKKDKPEGAKDRLSFELVNFILKYPSDKTRARVEKYRGLKTIYIIKNRSDINDLITKCQNIK
jgi:adenylate kinase family enzyme